MGASIKFNWVLQIEPPDHLEVDNSYEFTKPHNRIFPMDTPIDLIDLDRNAIAKIRVTSFTNSHEQTTGDFKVIKIYSDPEKSMLTTYWKENE